MKNIKTIPSAKAFALGSAAFPHARYTASLSVIACITAQKAFSAASGFFFQEPGQ